MMAGRKEYELLFKLQAALGTNYNSSFKTAIGTINQLQGSLTKVHKLQNNVKSYQSQDKAITASKSKLSELNAEHARLQDKMSGTKKPSAALQKELLKNEKQIAATTAKIEEQEQALESLGTELRKAGVDTKNLDRSNEKLSESYQQIKKSQEDLAKITAAQEKNNAAIAQSKTRILGTVGAATALGVAIYAGPVKSAMELESQMSEVAKVVDWIGKNGNAQQIASYKELKKSVLDVTTQIPMTAQEITEIMAAAGQSNIADDNAGLVSFTKDAAKMGIAFDTTSAQAGEWMAKWRTSFKMSQEQVVALSDQINYLGNTSAANARQISNIVTKVGPLGEVAGFASGEIAALGTAMVATGVQEDVAATGIKNVMLAMNMGAAVTDRQAEALKSLGFQSEKLAKRMQTDAKGAIIDFMEAVKKLPKEEQAASLQNFFGKESVAAIAPLLTNLDYLEEQFQKVGDASLYAGSMEAEYAARADTVENKVQLAKNSIAKLSTVVGEEFLPYITQGTEKLTELVTRFSDFVEKNPEAIKNFAELAAKLIALKLGGQAANLGFKKIKQGVYGAQKIVKLFSADTVVAGSNVDKSVGKMTNSIGMLKSAFTLLKGPVGITIAAIGAATVGIIGWIKHQEKARQDTLTFSDDLMKAADSFQAVSDKADSTKALSDEYRQLEQQTKSVATSADEAAQAKERMKEIEDILIEQNPDVLSKYDQENGKISENLDLLERKTQRELELAKIQYEQKRYEAEQKLPDALGEIAKLNANSESLAAQYDQSKKVRDEIGEILKDWEIFNATEHDAAAETQKTDELLERFRTLGTTVGKDWSFPGIGMEGVMATQRDYEKKAAKTVENIAKSQEELALVTQSVTDYYNSSVKLAEIDLGGNFQTVAANVAKMKSEVATLESKGLGGKSRAMDLKFQISVTEPKLLTAAATIRDLGTAVSEVPDMKTINVTDAVKNIDGLLKKLNDIPVSKTVELIVQQSGKRVSGYYTGGIITKPTLATFAEKVPEAAIPLDGSANSKALWARTGKLLGMDVAPRLAQIAGNSYGKAEVMPATVKAESGRHTATIKLESRPTIYVNGNKPDDLENQLARHDEELLRKLDERLRKQADDERRVRYD